jgi:hypothetical protein
MTDTTNDNPQVVEIKKEAGEKVLMETPEQELQEKHQENPGKFREASYVVLFIGAVFVVNAMETGSYRTPWPVAIITTLAGLGLFCYSWYLQSRSHE